MKTQEWTYEDKSNWAAGYGRWNEEPDKKQWMDPATRLPCLIVRAPSGALCGYVGVSEGHPYFGVDYSDGRVNVDAHGGLTFSDFCAKGEGKICHIVEPGENDRVWWLGFDCAHAGDYTPRHGSIFDYDSMYYRSMGYVEAEVAALARQLREAAKRGR